MKSPLLIILITGLLVSSCGEYEKLLKSSDFELKKNKAKEYYEEGMFPRASELLNQVLPRYRATEEAEELTWINAQCYYGMKDYMMAGSEFTNYANLYPFGKHAEDATFLAAMCDYYSSLRPELDQERTLNSIDGFNLYLKKFPGSQKSEEAKKYIMELQDKVVKKSYMSAKLYYDMKQYKSSIIALDISLKQYPETKYREEMMYLKLNSMYLYAENSVPAKQTERYQATLDDYYSFVEEFPKSTYSKDVTKIYQSTAKKLKINTGITQSNK
jgi:outer membrane protein assembly factor BamD